jgi:hypothetical protein
MERNQLVTAYPNVRPAYLGLEVVDASADNIMGTLVRCGLKQLLSFIRNMPIFWLTKHKTPSNPHHFDSGEQAIYYIMQPAAGTLKRGAGSVRY